MPDPCGRCALIHEQPVCTVCGGPAAEAHHVMGRQLDPLTVPRCEPDHDNASERRRISGIPLRADGNERHIAAIRHGFHEAYELLEAMQRHLDELVGDR